MKHYFSIKQSLRVVAFFVVLSLISPVYGQGTAGTDFWVAFMPNSYELPGQYPVAPLSLKLMIAGQVSCTGTVSNPHSNWSLDFVVNADETTTIDIPKDLFYYHLASDCVLDIGLHVVTTEPVKLYAINYRESSMDACNVLPAMDLGSEYYVEVYPSWYDGGITDHTRTEFSIVALENDTEVDIHLTDDTENGHFAQQDFSVTLERGQCYQVQSVLGGDLSGTRISAREGKRIAVFAGDRGVTIPQQYGTSANVFEQMPPVSSWGRCFVVTGSMMRKADRFRITSLYDNCEVYAQGGLLATLNANETKEFEINDDYPAVYIEAAKPILVVLYMVGIVYDNCDGDPSMLVLSPWEQAISDYAVFPVLDFTECSHFFVNVVTETLNVSGMRLDGTDIASQFVEVPDNPLYSYARIEIEPATHVLSNESGAFIAHTYGMALWVSYAFSVGSVALDNTFHLIVNEDFASANPQGFDACEDEPMAFSLVTNGHPTMVQWNFGDGSTASGYPVDHVFDTAGVYEVTCEVYSSNQQQPNILNTIIRVFPNYHFEMYQNACDFYEWNGQTYMESGVYEYQGQSINGCDSLCVLHLAIGHDIMSDTAATVCGEFVWYGEIYEESGEYYHHLQSHLGCDSVICLNLTVTPGSFEARLLGPEWIAASTDIVNGLYKYYVTDSLNIAPNLLNWTCNNPSWVLYPQDNGYSCKVWATGIGSGEISARTGMECDTIYSLSVIATWYDVSENEANSVAIYPNPADGQVHIMADKIQQIRIVDGMGRTIIRKEYGQTNFVTMETIHLTKGVYVVEITSQQEKTTKQLLIVR